MAGWGSPVLEGVRTLSDFGMVVVITAGAESAAGRGLSKPAHGWAGSPW